MTIELITRKRAVELVGMKLPAGMHWYLIEGANWYPNYGDWKQAVAGADGLRAVIGKQVNRKAVAA